jgi:tRNA-dihydrouridine synthase B
MIGRGAQGRPWLIQQIQQGIAGETVSEPSNFEKSQTLLAHVAALHAFYGDFLGVRIARKHVGWYLHNMYFSRAVSKAFNGLESQATQLDFLSTLLCRETGTH